MSLISSVALSLVGFAVSKCVGSEALSDAFFSELGVGSFGDIFKDGSEIAFAKFFKGTSNYNKDQLNHDLNKAARKSLLLATWFACRGVLLEFDYDDTKKAEKEWIAKLADSLKDKINKSLDKVPQTKLKESDVLYIFNSQTTESEIEENLTKKLQEEIYDIIRTDQSSFSLYTQSGFELLKKSIESGWTEQANPTSPEYHYNWFSLVCGIFNDECKTPRIEAALQNKLFKNLFVKLGEFGKSFDLISKEIADFREENYQQHKDTHHRLAEIKDLLDGRIFTEPKVTHNLPNSSIKVYGRDDEAKFLRQTLCGETSESQANRFALLVAPSGFGKSILLEHALKEVATTNEIKQNFQSKVQQILVIDCRNNKSLSEIVNQFNTLLGTQESYSSELDAASFSQQLVQLPQSKTWLILDNFEQWLDSNYNFINNETASFLNALLSYNDNLRGLLLSQTPPNGFNQRLNILKTLGETLRDGLPESEAIKMLRESYVGGLNPNDDSLLPLIKEFLGKVCHIPQAVSALIGYLNSRDGYTFIEFMNDESFWLEFDEEEHNLSDLHRGERHTKDLIKRQIDAQSDEVKLILKAIAYFNREVPKVALEALFESKAKASPHISRLSSHNLASTRQDRRSSFYYNLHSYFIEQSRKTLTPPFEESLDIHSYAYNIGNQANEMYKHRYLDLAVSLHELTEVIFLQIKEKIDLLKQNFDKIPDELIEHSVQADNDLAKAYLNKGNAIQLLGKLNEAIIEFDKAIQILKDLVDSGRTELANDLASAYMNKGNALEQQNESAKAVEMFSGAISLWENELNQGFVHNLPNLVKAYWIQVESLIKLEDWAEIAFDAIKSLALTMNFLEDENFSDHFKQLIGGEFGEMLFQIKQLSKDNQEKIFTEANKLGEGQGDALRELIKQMQ